jgi:hypothetical protein
MELLYLGPLQLKRQQEPSRQRRRELQQELSMMKALQLLMLECPPLAWLLQRKSRNLMLVQRY